MMDSFLGIFNFGKSTSEKDFKTLVSNHPYNNFKNASRTCKSDSIGICPITTFMADLPLPLYHKYTDEFNGMYSSLKTHINIMMWNINESFDKDGDKYGLCVLCTFQREFFRIYYDIHSSVLPQRDHFVGSRYLENYLAVALDIISRIKDSIVHARKVTQKEHEKINVDKMGLNIIGYVKQTENHIKRLKNRHDHCLNKELESTPFQEWGEKIMEPL